MAYKYLYQWSGSNYNKQKDLYNQLGSPMGDYKGTAQQNIWLLNKINSGTANPAPTTQTAPETAPSYNDLAQQYANEAGANKVYQGPVFSQVLPYDKAWGTIQPMIQQEAATQVNPYINRQLDKDLGAYYNQTANTGGGRFGFSGAGTVQAAAEANRKAQMLDWISGREAGFKQLFYDPAQQAFNRAIELGQTPTTPNIPTWNEMLKLYNGGTSTTAPKGTSLLGNVKLT